MLKQAFRFLGIGFFLSACLLLGLTYTNVLNTQPARTTTTVTTTQVANTTMVAGSNSNAAVLSVANSSSATTTNSESTTSEQASQTSQESAQNQGGTLTINEGDTSYSVAERLASQGIISNIDAFIEYLVANDLDTKIYNGTFTIPSGATTEEIAKILTSYSGN